MTDDPNIVAYEEGELDARGTLDLFAHLIESGLAWELQGHYGRTAAAFIQAGIISPDGTIDEDRVSECPRLVGRSSVRPLDGQDRAP